MHPRTLTLLSQLRPCRLAACRKLPLLRTNMRCVVAVDWYPELYCDSYSRLGLAQSNAMHLMYDTSHHHFSRTQKYLSSRSLGTTPGSDEWFVLRVEVILNMASDVLRSSDGRWGRLSRQGVGTWWGRRRLRCTSRPARKTLFHHCLALNQWQMASLWNVHMV